MRGMMFGKTVMVFCAVMVLLITGCGPKATSGDNENYSSDEVNESIEHNKNSNVNRYHDIVPETYGYDVSIQDMAFLADVLYGAGDIKGSDRILGWYIGMEGPAGGWIFYDCDADNDLGNDDGLKSSECGWRFLEAAPSDLPDNYAWGDAGSFGTRTEIGTGKENTKLIAAKSNQRRVNAARACMDYSENGYDDWFLPSKDELNLMFVNLKKKGIGGFDSSDYWSSSELSYYAGYAWKQDFNYGYQYFDYLRSNELRVRPFRAF